MNSKSMLTLLFLFNLAFPFNLRAGQPSDMTAAPAASPEFEKIKSLAGKWEGTAAGSHEAPNQKVDIEYIPTSGGSVVVEKIFTGTPHEMVSTYYDQNGKLSMTHYCMLGNRPELVLKKSDAGSLFLDFGPKNTIDPAKEMHMHSLKLSMPDKDTLIQEWTSYDGGKPGPTPTVLTLKRIA